MTMAQQTGRRQWARFFPLFLLLAGLAALAVPGAAQAQVTVDKELCEGGVCPRNSVSPGVALSYRITLNNTGAPRAVNVIDTLPPGFQVTGTTCGSTASTATSSATSVQITILSLPTGQTVCVLSGFFNAAVTGANNQVEVRDRVTGASLDTGGFSNAINLTGPLPIDLALTKTASVSTIDISTGAQIVTYTFRIKNLGPSDAYLGAMFALEDHLSLLPSSVVLDASVLSGGSCVVVPANSSLSPASDCLNPNPVSPPAYPVRVGSTGQYPLARWRFPVNSLGLLRSGDEIVLTIPVLVAPVPGADCVIVPGADGFTQRAQLTFNLLSPGGQPTALVDQLTTNNVASVPLSVITGATQVDPACNAPFSPPSPVLQIQKAQISPFPSTAPLAWAASPTVGSMAIYNLQIRNLSTNRRIRNIQLRDIVHEPVGTPEFIATYLSDTCPATVCTAKTGAPPQQLTGYGTNATVFNATLYGGTSTGLAPNGIVNFLIRLRYSNPRCDSLPDGNVDPVDNRMRILSWEEVDTTTNQVTVVNNQILQHQVTTRLQEAPRCPLVVTKARATPAGPFPPPDRIDFNQPYTYTVTFSNPTATAYTVGTLIDTLRFTAPATPAGLGPYAIQLQVDYNYSCAPNATGSVTGYPPGASNTVYAVASTLPQQGVRLIQNSGPVTFNANSSLVCTVTVIVRPPAATDPYCSIGLLDNAAILDLSLYYNANFPWPSSSPPGMWAHVTTPLPRCYNWVVNKVATPSWTWQGGGPLSWTYSVTNFGPPQTGSGPLIRDWFTTQPGNAGAPVDVTGFSVSCANPTTPCPTLWLGPNPAAATPGATTVQIPQAFATGQTMSVTMNVQNAPASIAPPNRICNNVAAYLLTNLGDNSYWKNPQTLAAQACIPVLETAPLTIEKRVYLNHLPFPVPASFQVTVNCTPYGPTNAVFQISPGSPATIARVPVGSQCTVTETPPPTPPSTAACRYPYWEIGYVPAAGFTIVSPTNRATVTNTARCRPLTTLTIRKLTVLPPGIPPYASFPVNVACAPYGPTTTVAVPANGQIVVPNIPVGSTCTLTEQLPQPPAGCQWTVVQSPAGPVPIVAPPLQARAAIENRLTCPVSDAGLLVLKRVLVNGSATPVSPATLPFVQVFPVNVTCGGTVTTLQLAAGNNFQAMVAPIAPNTVCTVIEPPVAMNAMWPNCTWVTTYQPYQQFTYTGGQIIVQVNNEQRCGGLPSPPGPAQPAPRPRLPTPPPAEPPPPR